MTATKNTTKPEAAAPLAPIQWDSLADALAAFQGEMPTVAKSQTAKIPGKDGRGGYQYKYADLADVAQAVHPVLSRHGLSFTSRPEHREGIGLVLVGVLRHGSGERDEGILPITGRSAQEIGSSLTYGRRYLLGCMTGVVTDEDEDGTAAAAAGTSRPQTQQQEQPGWLVDVLARLAALDDAEADSLRGWWKSEGLPGAHHMSQGDAKKVADKLDTLADTRKWNDVLRDRIAGLDPDEAADLRAWWEGEQLPPLGELDTEQSTTVLHRIEMMTGGQGTDSPY